MEVRILRKKAPPDTPNGLKQRLAADLERILPADAFAFAAGFEVGGERAAAVVVAPLEEDIVARLQLGHDAIPGAFVHVGACAAASDGAIGDVDAGGVEVVGEVVPPA